MYFYTIYIISRERLEEFRYVWWLRDAQEFLENFEWTDDALHDFKAVNIEGTHIGICGWEVCSYICSKYCLYAAAFITEVRKINSVTNQACPLLDT